MKTIKLIDYVSKPNTKLNLANFYDVDALILSQLSYLDFSHYKNKTKIAKMLKKHQLAASKTNSRLNNEALFKTVITNDRYKHLKIYNYEEEASLLFELQFSAVTFLVNKSFIVVAFRGTDNTINGWKEDFNMGFLKEIPAQKLAVEYLEKIAKKHKRKKIIVVGHSKGGNLAFYAAMKQNSKIQKRLLKIYNLDGPDFLEEISTSEEYQNILPKCVKIVPEESVIGMILQTHQEYIIVKADGSLLEQHKLFTWQIDDETNNLIYVTSLSKSSKRIRNSLFSWFEKFNLEEREMVIDSFFDMLHVSEVQTISEFKKDLNKNLALLYGEYKESDSQTKKLLRKTLYELVKFLTINYFKTEKALDKKI